MQENTLPQALPFDHILHQILTLRSIQLWKVLYQTMPETQKNYLKLFIVISKNKET